MGGTSFLASLVRCWIAMTLCEDSSDHVSWAVTHALQMNWPQVQQYLTAFPLLHLSQGELGDSTTFLSVSWMSNKWWM